MSNVTLNIGGRAFTVACGAGEEAHISALGKMIDAKVHALGQTATQNETRMMLFAALMLADELEDARRGVVPPPSPPPPAPQEDPELARKLETIALQLEKCAEHLEQAAKEA